MPLCERWKLPSRVKRRTVRSLYLEESITLDREIQRIAGMLQSALRHTQPVAAQHAVVVDRLAELGIMRARPQNNRAEKLSLSPVSRRLGIGKIRCGRVEGLRARNQTAHGRVVTTVH